MGEIEQSAPQHRRSKDDVPSLPPTDDLSIHSPTSRPGSPADEFDHMINASWKVKTMVLICMLTLPVGCHFMDAIIGTLKTSLKTTMQINNTQFGILLSGVTLVNTVLPLLAGAFVDDIAGFGSVRATTMTSFMIFGGSLVVSLAASYNNYPAMIVGQMIYGLGGGMIVTMQEAIVSKWFRNHQLAIVIGIVLSLARLVKWIAKMVCYPIVNATGNNNTPIFIATMICAIGFSMNGVYWFIMCRYGWATRSGKELRSPGNPRPYSRFGPPQSQDDDNSKYSHHLSKSYPALSLMTSIRWILQSLPYLPVTYWPIIWLQLIFSSVLSSFDDIATEFVQFKFHTTTVMAGYQSSLTQVVPIVVGPLMGFIIHRWGHRLTSLLVGTLFLTLSLLLMGYTMTLPAIGMILFSCALAFGPVAILSSSSLLLPVGLVGVGTGLHKCANNIGTTIVAVLVGYVQDLTYHDGNPADNNSDLRNEYDGVMILYLCMACGSILLALVLWWMDRRLLMGWLQIGKKERDRRIEWVMEEQEKQHRNSSWAVNESTNMTSDNKSCLGLASIGSQLRSKKSYVYVGIYCFWLVAAWIIFFVFALMPIYMNYD